jgi:hypothetical protein
MRHDVRVAELVIPFGLRGVRGRITVDVGVNEDPLGWGCDLLTGEIPPLAALGFPVCRAVIEYDRDGYAAALGWIQLVQASDSGGEPDAFEIDPIAIYRDVATPYAWFGIKPVFFDAPFRPDRYELRWRARSFLCFSPDAVMSRWVRAATGFRWGFDVHDGEVHLSDLRLLTATAWDEHLALLRSRYPDWRLDQGFHDR